MTAIVHSAPLFRLNKTIAIQLAIAVSLIVGGNILAALFEIGIFDANAVMDKVKHGLPALLMANFFMFMASRQVTLVKTLMSDEDLLLRVRLSAREEAIHAVGYAALSVLAFVIYCFGYSLIDTIMSDVYFYIPLMAVCSITILYAMSDSYYAARKWTGEVGGIESDTESVSILSKIIMLISASSIWLSILYFLAFGQY